MVDKPVNQNNYSDSQTFEIDINKVYSDFIQEIDSSRSCVNISNNENVLKNLNAKNISSIADKLKVENTPQESRCHAFYRLIGFPVVGADKRYYNPGLDRTQSPEKNIKIADKIKIANHPMKGFNGFSSQRERYVNGITKVFSVSPSTVTAGVLALSSGTNTRKFIDALQDDDPFSFSLPKKSYADFSGLVGANKILLTYYVDLLGGKPNINDLKKDNRYHLIKPFMVDPRIDFSAPGEVKVAVPFVPNKSYLKVNEQTFAKRPLLEKVIRDRFNTENQISTTGSAEQEVIDFILKVPGVQKEDIIKQMTSSVYKLDDKLQFIKYLNIIRAMIAKLWDAQKCIQGAQSMYYWLPAPSVNGPEGGCEIRDIIILKEMPEDFITSLDRSIISNFLQKESNKFNAQTADTSGTPDVGGFVFNNFGLTFDHDTSNSLGDTVSDAFNYLNKRRSNDLNIAGDSLRTVEIIMGEFSGLGLCDIIAVMASLYIMPKEDLVHFLDADAFIRLLDTPKVGAPSISPYNLKIETAQKSFVAKMKDFYNLMDKVYQDVRQNNGIV